MFRLKITYVTAGIMKYVLETLIERYISSGGFFNFWPGKEGCKKTQEKNKISIIYLIRAVRHDRADHTGNNAHVAAVNIGQAAVLRNRLVVEWTAEF